MKEKKVYDCEQRMENMENATNEGDKAEDERTDGDEPLNADEEDVDNKADGKSVEPEPEQEEAMEPWRKDPRITYIRTIVERLLSVKTDHWIKMIDKPEMHDTIYEFLNNVDVKKLFFIRLGANVVPSLHGFPAAETIKGKFVYFLRLCDRQEITEDNFAKVLLSGSCSDNPIHEFSVFVNSAIVPLLMNPQNQAKWPQVLKDEMRKKLQDLRNSITEAMGAINDHTVFPLPVTLPALIQNAPAIMAGDFTKFTPVMKESIEQIVLRWSRSVMAYVARSSFDIFKTRKYATPDDECDFWRMRLINLKSIFDQLRTKEIKTIALILEHVDSVYVKQMKRIISSVAYAYEETYDIDLYLKPLQCHLDKMRSTDFTEAKPLIAPLLHTVVLIWANSKFLSSNERIVHLFRLIHHRLFEFVMDSLNPTSIFAGDIADTLEKIDFTLKNLQYYKDTYEECRSKLSDIRPKADDARPWSFDPDDIFANFNLFVARLVKVNEMLRILFELKKGEDTVFGGHNGKWVTQSVRRVADSLAILTDQLKDNEFNVLDLDETDNFDRLTQKFEKESADLQQRLAKQYITSFNECNTITKCIKLIINLANTLHLPMIYDEVSPMFEKIPKMLESEVIDVENIFTTQSPDMKEKPLEEILIWSRKLKNRLTEQTKYVDSQRIKLFSSDFGEYAMVRYTQILNKIEEWEAKCIESKCDQYESNNETLMANFLLRRNSDGRLAVNVQSDIDVVLLAINRMSMNEIDHSDSLKEFWSRRDELWSLKIKLYRITEWYNFTNFEVWEEDKLLIQPNTEAIDGMINDFLITYTWNSYDNAALDELFNTLEHLYRRIVKAHQHIDKMIAKIHTWRDIPLYTRHGDKNLLCIDHRDEIVEQRYKLCLETQKLIETVMHENFSLFQNKGVSIDADGELVVMHTDQIDSEEEQYHPYLSNVDKIVCKDVLAAIETSLKYLHDEIHKETSVFEVCFSLDVENRKSIFHPELEVEAKEGFVAFVTSLMVDIFRMAALIKRVIPNTEAADFTSFVQASSSIEDLRQEILVQAKNVSKKTLQEYEVYQKYSFIWEIERTEYLRAFLKYGRQLSIDDMANIQSDRFNEQPCSPTLDAFENEIKRHRDLIPQIEDIPEFIDTAAWFRVKNHLFKTKLVAETQKWLDMFVEHLHDHVSNRLQTLELFILDANIVLSSRCDKSELDKFRKMYSLMEEIERQANEVDFMFGPLKAEVMLLRKYDHEMEMKVKEQFVELPLWWSKLKKLKDVVRNDIDSVKQHQMGLTLKRLKLFTMRIHDFQQRFHQRQFFQRNCTNAYEIIDEMLDHITKYERQAELLDIYASLFHINVGPNHALMKECRKETKVLKPVWDYWYSFQYRSELWANTLW